MSSATGDTHIRLTPRRRRDRRDVPRRIPTWRIIAGGAVLGLAWGILARIWMRLIATVPEFTWSGTLFILGLATLTGTSLATVEALRRRGMGWWRHLLAVPALMLFAGQGALMAPTALLGGLALSGRGPRWARFTLAALSLAPIALIATSDMDLGYSGVIAIVGLTLLSLTLAAGWSAAFRAKPGRTAFFRIDRSIAEAHSGEGVR
jgi:hypothetical protein